MLTPVGVSGSQSGMSRLTTEYVYWPFQGDNAIFTEADAQVSFRSSGDIKPGEEDWFEASIIEYPDDATLLAVRALIGPKNGGVDLTPDTAESVNYYVWVKIITSNEEIVRRAGTLMIR